MLPPWQTGIVVRIQEETPITKRFWIQVPDTDRFDFKPGQFVTLDLPIHELKNKRWRSYSIASAPDGSNIFELVIVLLEGGLGTDYLFHQVEIGSQLTFRGPAGVFVLPEPIDRDLFFICTGTGVAPFRSMSHHILNHHIPHGNIYLVFGCRKLGDTLYKEELEELASKEPSFHYLPTYSREEPGQAGIQTGYVHQIYETICRQKISASPDNRHPAYFYLCGWKEMIEEAKKRLLTLGYEKKDIHQELYG